MKSLRTKVLFLFVLSASVILFTYITSGLVIGNQIDTICDNAKKQYLSDDCVKVMIILLEDKNQSFKSRNQAIWALGQLGDKSVLPVLQKYYTGNTLPRETLDKGISQYELEKAIKLLSRGVNITSWVWRRGVK